MFSSDVEVESRPLAVGQALQRKYEGLLAARHVILPPTTGGRTKVLKDHLRIVGVDSLHGHERGVHKEGPTEDVTRTAEEGAVGELGRERVARTAACIPAPMADGCVWGCGTCHHLCGRWMRVAGWGKH